MIKIGISKLRNKLGEYLRLVKNGETIIVTERGKPIGLIVPVKPTTEEKMQAVVDAGLAEWNGKKVKPVKPVAKNRRDQQISDLVSEDRASN
jgi:prevent-host-death family protein